MKTLDEENTVGLTASAKPAADAINILLVDDEGRNLDVLESILESPGLRFIRSMSPEEALLALVHEEFACIVLDIHMPSMNGLDLARLIKTRRRNQNTPIIFLTAYFLEEKDILQGYGAGAVDYLTKPINPQILKSKVGVFVDLFRTARALALANHALELEVTHRKNAEQALREMNTELETSGQKMMWQLAAIVESSDDAIVSKDLDGIISSWNRGAERLFGYRADEVLGKPISILIPTERLDEEPDILRRIRQGNSIEHYETTRRCKDGTLVEISLTVSPMRDASGKVVGASKIARDITKTKQAENELKSAHEQVLLASRAKDDFFAALSHELRTPLNPVLLIASDAANNHELSPRVRTDFATIRKNIELEARLIDDLLDLTRITRGKISLNKQTLDARQVMEEAVSNVKEEMNQKQIALDLKLDAAQHTVFADAVRLQQIFLNLLKNAVKFTPQGGQIAIESDAADGKLLIKIRDTGIGMLPEEITGIFTAFSQGSHAKGDSRHQFGGLGLGLAISQRLAEFHSGQIRAMSAGREKGSTFVIELPLAKADGHEEPLAAVCAPGSAAVFSPSKNSIRILLVEDHGPTRTTLTHLLMRRNFKVLTAASVAEARAVADTEHFNLLISDIGLPDGNGCELMEEFKKRFNSQGIALTGYGMEQDVARSQNAGFAMHLTKPVRVESLDNALAAILNRETCVEQIQSK